MRSELRLSLLYLYLGAKSGANLCRLSHHGSRDGFRERPEVAAVGAVESVQVAAAALLEDDDRRPAQPNQDKVEQQPAPFARCRR